MKRALFQIIFLGLACTATAQVKIGDNPSSIHPDAVLETESANKGLLLPRVALISSTDSAPLNQHVAGMIVYNTANITGLPSGFYYNNGTKWIGLSSSDMGAVLSVYGRTGTVVAENGDYTTALVPDTPDKRYQTDDQFLFNDATSSIQTQLNSKETAIALGNVSQYYRGDKIWAVLDKNAVGLGLVDNTADIDKPISRPTQAALDLKAPLASPKLSGIPTAPTAAPGTSTNQIATTEFVKNIAGTKIEDQIKDAVTDKAPSQNAVYDALTLKANLDSPVFTGIPELPSHTKATTQNLWDNSDKIATTAYVHNMTTGKIQNTINDEVLDSAPTQNAVYDALELKAPLASPNLTGLPTAPTAAPGTSSNQIATTEFVQGLAGTKIEDQILDAVTDKAPSQNAVYDALTLKANLNSPVFTGIPSLPTDAIAVTQPVGDDSRKIATTAYVKSITTGKIQDAIQDQVLDSAPTQNAVYDALELKAPVDDAQLTGTPKAPTAPVGTNTTQIATTEFVQNLAGIKIEDQITDAVTDKAPSQNAVFDALGLKQNVITLGTASQYRKGDHTLGGFEDDVNQVIDSNKNIPGGIAGVDNSGKIPGHLLPDLTTNQVYVVNSQAEMLILATRVGDIVIRTDIQKTYIKVQDLTNPSAMTDFAEFLNSSTVSSVFGRIGTVSAEIGDYNTGQVTEVTNKRYQTDNQNLFNDATSSIQTQLDSKAPLANPALTGIPTAPTAAAGTNSIQIATTEFVTNALVGGAISDATELTKGKVQLATAEETRAGTVPDKAVHPLGLKSALDLKANLNSPVFTGAPSLPADAVAITQSPGDNSLKIATTQYVDQAATLTVEDNIADAVLDKAPSQNAVYDALTLKANLDSPIFTGTPSLPTAATAVTQSAHDNSRKIATTEYADAAAADAVEDAIVNEVTDKAPSQNAVHDALELKADLDSPIFAGTPSLPTDAIAVTQTPGDSSQKIATTQYVDEAAALLVEDTIADAVLDKAPSQNAVFDALTIKADLDSPVFTGNPHLPTDATAVTQSAGDSSEKIATTEFVSNAMQGGAIPDATESAPGKVQLATTAETIAGTVPDKAVHPLGLKSALDLKANLQSPALTGIPTAPTAAPGTNTTQVATTQFVEAAKGWGLAGNTGTAATFMGTTGNFALPFRSNNVERMRIMANGNVGIGTDAPYSLLDVKGNLYTSFHGNNSMHHTSERGSRFIGNKSGNTTDGFTGMELEIATQGSGNGGNIHFLTWGNAISTQRRIMTIKDNGRIGIGTTDPTVKLHINNGSTAGAIRIVDGSQGVSKVLTSNADGVGTWQSISGSWAAYAWNATNPHSDAVTRAVTLTTANSRINGNGGSVSPSNGRIYVPTDGLYRIIVYLDFLNGTLAGGNSCADIQIDTYNSSNTRIYHNCDVVGAAGTKTNGYMQAIVNLPAGGYVVVLTKNNAHEGVISVERITN